MSINSWNVSRMPVDLQKDISDMLVWFKQVGPKSTRFGAFSGPKNDPLGTPSHSAAETIRALG